MSIKQFLISTEGCVDEMLEAIEAVNPGFVLLPQQRVIVERSRVLAEPNKKTGVALMTGGGSGHEPFPMGYIGGGMLSGAVAGHVFTAPPSAKIAAAITALGKDNPDGVLVIVFNYTGDRLNFGLAVERCKAAGIKVEMYVSGDDCAITQLQGTTGRRGLCGTIFILKIVGALVEKGASLAEALQTCKILGRAMGTIGVAASGCTLPGASGPLFTVETGHLELGLGVHGEAGVATIPSGSLSEVVNAMLSHLTNQESNTRLELQQGDEVAVIVNNLGNLTHLEMSNVTKEVVSQLKARCVNPIRVYAGPLMTSLDMKGFHISVLRLDDPSWITLLDSYTTAPGWPAPCLVTANTEGEISIPDIDFSICHKNMGNIYTLEDTNHVQIFKRCLQSVVTKMPQHEQLLNALDTECGDGDCGSTFLKGVTGLAKSINTLSLSQPYRVLFDLGDIASQSMGGTLGGLYSILFTGAGISMANSSGSHKVIWAAALRGGTKAISKYGGAAPGDRTMIDAIVPAIEALEKSTDDDDLRTILKAMAAKGDEGARRTSNMKPGVGRATYVRQGKLKGEDAGARCVALVLDALSQY